MEKSILVILNFLAYEIKTVHYSRALKYYLKFEFNIPIVFTLHKSQYFAEYFPSSLEFIQNLFVFTVQSIRVFICLEFTEYRVTAGTISFSFGKKFISISQYRVGCVHGRIGMIILQRGASVRCNIWPVWHDGLLLYILKLFPPSVLYLINTNAIYLRTISRTVRWHRCEISV